MAPRVDGNARCWRARRRQILDCFTTCERTRRPMSSSHGPDRRATILVVDDDPDVRETLHDQLAIMSYDVVAVDSAEAALDATETSVPDLVLTDVHMGAMSGIELCGRLKRDTRFQLIPVILLTAVSDLDARVAGLAAGADDFFAKP